MIIKKIFIISIAILAIFTAQGQNSKLNFVIIIDNEINNLNIADGVFQIQYAHSGTEEKLAFKYHVGDLELSKNDINKLFNIKTGDKLVIRFNTITITPSYSEKHFEYEIPIDWINDEYMLMKIFTVSKKNKKIYYFGNKNYLIEFSIPSQSTLIPHKK